MKGMRLGTLVLLLSGGLTACVPSSGTAAPTSPPASTPTTALAPPPVSQASSTPASATQPASTATALDPCALVPPQEASSVAGATYTQGQEETTPDGGGKRCVYGSNTTNVFEVEVAQAPDVATAQQYRDSYLADIQSQAAQFASQGLTVIPVPDFADGAVQATLSVSYAGHALGGSAFAFLKGTVFVGMSDISRDTPAATIDSLQTEATTVIGRLP
jgi:hypothetical protein